MKSVLGADAGAIWAFCLAWARYCCCFWLRGDVAIEPGAGVTSAEVGYRFFIEF